MTDLLLSDESGNVRGLVQLSSGTHQNQLVNYTDYDAYGNPTTESGGSTESGGLTTPQTGLNANWVGSTGWGFGEGYSDPTGLVYLVNRYYDPTTGQFLSLDPKVQQTNEPYEYADADPVNLVDPDGAIWKYWISAGEARALGTTLIATGTATEIISDNPEVNWVVSLLAGQASRVSYSLGYGLCECAQIVQGGYRLRYPTHACGIWVYTANINLLFADIHIPYGIAAYLRYYRGSHLKHTTRNDIEDQRLTYINIFD